ncbi:hypothetical protein NKR23_g11825 [Pleurostoma richardsiae]|uniref:Pinin/SDK/MemA protein domain-containing protein n=1 Tax=Pleurostoma richardsiae TaxID=41990 RepID=A0AA38R717_9PEZI|nr:hypothetical protein NKR23_g11825 [Pleurostoma richardsiae]
MPASEESPSGVEAPEAESTSPADTKREDEHSLPQKRKSISPSPSAEGGSTAKRPKTESSHDEGAALTQDLKDDKYVDVGREQPRARLAEGRIEPREELRKGKEVSPRPRATEARRESFSGPDRRRNFSQEERKRGQRLFGGLLSTLSQTNSNSQHKRRLEIERRQQEKAQQRKIEDDKRRTEKLEKLSHVRKIEQVKFDEQVMRTRHSNMLAMAHNLRTKSEPKLYYRPWELTRAQGDKIEDQIRDAEGIIDEEIQRFKRRKEQRLKELGAYQPSNSDDMVGDPIEEGSNAAKSESTNPEPAPPLKQQHAHDRDHDENGDVIVEAEEDTVIY